MCRFLFFRFFPAFSRTKPRTETKEGKTVPHSGTKKKIPSSQVRKQADLETRTVRILLTRDYLTTLMRWWWRTRPVCDFSFIHQTDDWSLLLQSHGSVANADSKTAGKRGQKPRKKPGGKNGKEATKKVHGAAGETGVQWPWVTLQRSAARLSSHLHLDFCYLPLRHQWRFRRFKNRGWLSGRSGFFPLIIIIFFTSWMWVNFWGDKNKVKKKRKKEKSCCEIQN